MSDIEISEALVRALLDQAMEECGGDLESAALSLAATAVWHKAKFDDLMNRVAPTDEPAAKPN